MDMDALRARDYADRRAFFENNGVATGSHDFGSVKHLCIGSDRVQCFTHYILDLDHRYSHYSQLADHDIKIAWTSYVS